MKASTKRAARDTLTQWAYAALGLAWYGPKSWAIVTLVLCVIALVLNESTARGDT